MIVFKIIVVLSLAAFFLAACKNNKSAGSSDAAIDVAQDKKLKDDDEFINFPSQFGTRVEILSPNDKFYSQLEKIIVEGEITAGHKILQIARLDSGDYEVMTQRAPNNHGGAFLLIRIENNSNIQVIEKMSYDE